MTRTPSVSAILAAGGLGTRMGGGLPKQFRELGGRTLLERSLAALAGHPRVSEVVVALPAAHLDPPPACLAAEWPCAVVAVEGGDRRRDSVARAFSRVSAGADVVLVHDAARPFVSAALIDRMIDAVADGGAAVPAVRARDTVKRGVARDGGVWVERTLPRGEIYLVQTPQAFGREQLARAFAMAGDDDATDEAALVERAGGVVRIVDGEDTNVKITTADDLRAGIAAPPGIPAMRIGTGYDLHRLVPGRRLVLAGVDVPFESGLDGHSDADIVCHAVTDAVLGAAALGDIGRLFPDTDAVWKDADSVELLRQAVARVHASGLRVGNVDVTVVAQRPKLLPYLEAMRARLAAALAVDVASVSIKGKTNEGVDSMGRGESMACHAVALLLEPRAPASREPLPSMIRVRFAPSPTGHLHVGNARTALFNWLLARHHGGTFILRVEDTDRERSTAASERRSRTTSAGSASRWDEGVDAGGELGPYRQSERLALYDAHTERLLEERARLLLLLQPQICSRPSVRRRWRPASRRSTAGACRTIALADARARRAAGERPAVRLRVPADRTIDFVDLVRGRVAFHTDVIGDPVIVRGDGVAAYNYAVVIDDALMQITHVVRGEDHISNTPRQILVYEAFGWTPPAFAHLSLVLGPDHAPLSKRHGATSVAEFRTKGYLPEALANYLALIGWSPGDGEEVLPLDELARRFDLAAVGHSAGVFDEAKLAWVNRHYLKTIDPSRLITLARPYLEVAGMATAAPSTAAQAWLADVLPPLAASIDRLTELPERMHQLFRYDAAAALARADVRCRSVSAGGPGGGARVGGGIGRRAPGHLPRRVPRPGQARRRRHGRQGQGPLPHHPPGGHR